MKKGYFAISLDFELLWGLAGWTVEEIKRYQPRAEGAVGALRRIVELLSKYGMKCSIAHVGAMDYHSVEELLRDSDGIRPSYANPLFSSYESLLGCFLPHNIGKDIVHRAVRSNEFNDCHIAFNSSLVPVRFASVMKPAFTARAI